MPAARSAAACLASASAIGSQIWKKLPNARSFCRMASRHPAVTASAESEPLRKPRPSSLSDGSGIDLSEPAPRQALFRLRAGLEALLPSARDRKGGAEHIRWEMDGVEATGGGKRLRRLTVFICRIDCGQRGH